MAKLSDAQVAQVRTWAENGATLNDIQNKLRDECGVSLTYMETRLVLIDHDITLIPPKEESAAEKEQTAKNEPDAAGQEAEAFDDEPEILDDSGEETGAGPKVSVDEITLPGAVASGKVTFSDGISTSWYVDQYGRLGLVPPSPGYQPPAGDVPGFQRSLQQALRRYGF